MYLLYRQRNDQPSATNLLHPPSSSAVRQLHTPLARRRSRHTFLCVWAPSAAAGVVTSLISCQVLAVGRGGVQATNVLSGLLVWRPALVRLRTGFSHFGHKNTLQIWCVRTLFSAPAKSEGWDWTSGFLCGSTNREKRYCESHKRGYQLTCCRNHSFVWLTPLLAKDWSCSTVFKGCMWSSETGYSRFEHYTADLTASHREQDRKSYNKLAWQQCKKIPCSDCIAPSQM